MTTWLFPQPELDALITDLTGSTGRFLASIRRWRIKNVKDEIADTMSAIDHQLARVEEQRQKLSNVRARAVAAS